VAADKYQIKSYLIKATWPIAHARTHTHTHTHNQTEQTQKTDMYIEESESNKTIKPSLCYVCKTIWFR